MLVKGAPVVLLWHWDNQCIEANMRNWVICIGFDDINKAKKQTAYIISGIY